MSPELMKKTVEALNQRGFKAVCPICGGRTWQVVDLIHGQVWQEDGALTLGGPNVPMVAVACERCTFLAFFSAVALGILPRDPES